MGDPSDDDVPTMTSSADLRPSSSDEESQPTLESRSSAEATIPRRRPSASSPGPLPSAAIVNLGEPEDDAEESVTMLGPRLAGPQLKAAPELKKVEPLKLDPPGVVAIRTLDDDDDDDDDEDDDDEDGAETEVRTFAGSIDDLVKEANADARDPVYDDESVTRLGPAVVRGDGDDNTTARAATAPVKSRKLNLPAAIDGETEGTTRKVRPRSSAPSEAFPDEESPSITAPAPGHLTNMLRVIAAAPADADEDAAAVDDDPLQAHTMVMAHAPMKPSSEAALRIPGQVASHDVRTPRDKATRPPAFPPPPLHEPERKPPYALVVGIVAAISIAIPVLLFVVLRQSSDEDAPRVAAQPSSEPVTRGDAPRPRASNQHRAAPPGGPPMPAPAAPTALRR